MHALAFDVLEVQLCLLSVFPRNLRRYQDFLNVGSFYHHPLLSATFGCHSRAGSASFLFFTAANQTASSYRHIEAEQKEDASLRHQSIFSEDAWLYLVSIYEALSHAKGDIPYASSI